MGLHPIDEPRASLYNVGLEDTAAGSLSAETASVPLLECSMKTRQHPWPLGWLGLTLLLWLPFAGALAGEDSPDITGGVIPLLASEDRFGSGGELSSDGHLSTRAEMRYRVRVKNQSGDAVEGDSLIVVVQAIRKVNGLYDVLDQVDVVGADGVTGEGRPYFRVPLGGESELGPYTESEEFPLEIRNPDLLVLYPPVLRVRGRQVSTSQKYQDMLKQLGERGAEAR